MPALGGKLKAGEISPVESTERRLAPLVRLLARIAAAGRRC
jgi:hypothetical protein